MDESRPGLSWQIRADEQGVIQQRYQIIVSEDIVSVMKGIGTAWDSKPVVSEQSLQVPYGGEPLASGKKYWWRVRVWDTHGHVSGWSPAAEWHTGLFRMEDWKGAQWIARDILPDTSRIAPHLHGNGPKRLGPRRDTLPLLRRGFRVSGTVSRAMLYISGLGHFEVRLNGVQVGDQFLAPGWTDYARSAQYVTFDVTNQLKPDVNALGVSLGNGFLYIPSERYRKMTGAYGLPMMKARLHIEYADGRSDDIVSDTNWRTAMSPVIYSSIFGGEDYDAMREMAGWDLGDYNDRQWQAARIAAGPILLRCQSQEPVKILQTLAVRSVQKLRPGVDIYDLGQNFSGVPGITVTGNRGDTVILYPAELVHADGSANQNATGKPTYFKYILKGGGAETWHPRFSYTGFRYVEVHRKTGPGGGAGPQVQHLQGLHVRNAAEEYGSFQCSYPLFNRIDTLIRWAIRSNMMSVFTDCPHREKLGWLEQTHLMGASVHFVHDAAALNRKMIRDMMEAQYPDGKIPEIAPEYTRFTPPFDESPEWGSASVILPWYQYLWYGDLQTLREAYDMMKGYVGYLDQRSDNGLLRHGLGDWFDLGPQRPGVSQLTRPGITATATWYYDLTIMARAAEVLGYDADVAKWRDKSAFVKAAFQRTFFDPVGQQFDSASQTANAMALYMGLADSSQAAGVLKALTSDIRRRDNALTAGDIGYRYVLKTLSAAGLNDLVYDMNARDDVPGYGYQLRHGATALTESWAALPSVSNNHFMLGHLLEWFYERLLGIRQREGSIGYRELVIEPVSVGDVKSAKGGFNTAYGRLHIDWKSGADKFEMMVMIPSNSKAQVIIPADPGDQIWMNGRLVREQPTSGKIEMNVMSGRHAFIVRKKR